MNFDELKKQWDNQSTDNVEINEFEKHTEACSIIDRVRQVMKKDFFFQLTTFPMLFFYPYIFKVNTPLMWFLVLCYVVIMVVPLSVLFRFYKESYQLEYNSLKNLNWFYYNYKFSIELFKIYNYLTFVLILMFIGVVFLEKIQIQFVDVTIGKIMIVILGMSVFALFCIWMTRWWIRKFYSTPLEEIKQILDSLEE